jgi:hypothetical protein
MLTRLKPFLRKIFEFFFPYYLFVTGKIRNVKKASSEGKVILSVFFHNPKKDLFESLIKWFIKNHYNFISVDQLYEIYAKDKPFPVNAVLLTVDDGWKENKDNLVAVANKYNIPVTIFINTDPIKNGDGYWVSYLNHKSPQTTSHSVDSLKKINNSERVKIVDELKSMINIPREALTIDELKKIQSANISLGAHTISHPFLVKCTDEEARHEIKGSRDILENWLGRKVDTFAYPFGNYGDRELALVKAAGYKMAFSTISDYITKENIKDIYKIPRFEVVETASVLENICRMTGAWDHEMKRIKTAKKNSHL